MLAKIKLIFIILRGRIDMVVMYVALIVKGKKTFAQVPEKLKVQVKEILIDLELSELVTE
jgi:hypothetical protein